MNHNVVIRRFEDGDEEKVNELLAAVFGDWKGREYWRWKYKENPAGFYSNIWLAEEGGRVISHYAIIPVMIKVNDEVILGGQGLDTATHPDYRRQGLFATLAQMTLTEAVKNGIQIMYGFPGSMSYGGFIQIGWHYLGSVPRHYRVLNVGDALRLRTAWNSLMKANTARLIWKTLRKQELTVEERSRLRPIRQMLLLLAVFLSNPRCLFRPGNVRQMPGLIIKEVDSFDERITSFWREISQYFPVAVDRNAEYLNWRYKLNPAGRYVIFIAENRGQIEGYMVLKSERDEGIIMDIISRENQVFSCLLHKALRYFTDEGKAIVECWMPDNFTYSKILRKFGFGSYQWMARWASRPEFLRGMMNPVVFHISSPDDKKMQRKLQRLDSWFLAAGDSDLENVSQFMLGEEP